MDMEKILQELETMQYYGWKHSYGKTRQGENGAYIPDGEEFFKEFSPGIITSITINSILSGEEFKESQSLINFYESDKKIPPVVGWRVDFWKVNKKTGELMEDYGGLKIYGIESYVHILDYTHNLMQECEKIFRE